MRAHTHHYYLYVTVGLVVSVVIAAASFAYAGEDHVAETYVEKKTFEEPVVKTTYQKSSDDISLAQFVELLIKLEIISPEKAEAARAVVKDQGISTAGTLCPSSAFRYNLYLGMSDEGTEGEVTRLQKWLAEMPEVYPEGLITGYFGPATEQAVQRYQTKQGIVSSGAPETTGYGVIGPKTRSTINACLYAKYVPFEDKEEVAEEKKEEEQVEDKDKDEVDTSAPLTAIELNVDQSAGKVWWHEVGYAADGFVVVWSKESNPTYPIRDYDRKQIYDEPTADHARLEAFDGAGRYHVRVCEYKGDTCGVYSNSVTIELE